VQVQGRAKISVQAVTKYQRSSSNSRAVRHARHERKQSICEYGSGFAYWRRHRRGRIGLRRHGAGLGGSLGEVN
jgi:hypothetical protein